MATTLPRCRSHPKFAAILVLLLQLTFYWSLCLSESVTVWTTSQVDGSHTVCVGQRVAIACHSHSPAQYMWHCDGQPDQLSANGSIIVVAGRVPVMCTCFALDGDRILGNSSVTVTANGTAPVIIKETFHNYYYATDGNNISLTVTIASDQPILADFPKWSVVYVDHLPAKHRILNFTSGSVIYNSLELYDLSHFDDSGNYTIVVANECGSTTASVYLEIYATPLCYQFGESPPLVKGPSNILTVEDEQFTFKCYFKGDYETVARLQFTYLHVYWSVDAPNQDVFNILYGLQNDTYNVLIKPACDGTACCTFVSELSIRKIPLYLDQSSLTCHTKLDTYGNGALMSSGSSRLYVLPKPVLSKFPSDVAVQLHHSVNFRCVFATSTTSHAAVIVWTKDSWPVTSDGHYDVKNSDGDANSIISILTVDDVSHDDVGQYSCYCYYNRSVVYSQSFVSSGVATATLTIKQNSDNTFIVIVASILLSSVIMIVAVAVMLVGVILLIKRRSRHVTYVNLPDEKCPLVKPSEEETDDSMDYGINKQTSPKMSVAAKPLRNFSREPCDKSSDEV